MMNNLLKKINSDQSAPIRLICFPCSGGGVSMYRHWQKKLVNVEIYAALLPGREQRINEIAITEIKTLVSQLIKEMKAIDDKPYILFGHSMGGLIAYELACEIMKKGFQSPSHLVVSAFRSPERNSTNKVLHRLPDHEFIQELKHYGGTPEQVLEDREAMELYLPTIRADFKLHETYQFSERYPLDCAISTFSGNSDHIVPSNQMIGWSEHTHHTHEHYNVPGGHFFISNSQNIFFPRLQNILNECLLDAVLGCDMF